MDFLNNNVQVYFPTVYKDKLISLNTKKVIKYTNVPSGTISFEIVGTSDIVTCNVSDIQSSSFVAKLDSNHNSDFNNNSVINLNNINITDNINNNLSTLQAKVIDFNTNYIKIKPSINIKEIISQMSNYNFISSDKI